MNDEDFTRFELYLKLQHDKRDSREVEIRNGY